MGSAVAITKSTNTRSASGVLVDTRIVGCNPAALDLFGVQDKADLCGSYWSAWRTEEDEAFSNRRFAVMSEFPDADVPSQFPCTILRADGDRIRVRKHSQTWMEGGKLHYLTHHERIKGESPVPDLDWHALGLTDEIYIKHCGFGNMTEAEALVLQTGLNSLDDSALTQFAQYYISKCVKIVREGGHGQQAWRVEERICANCGYPSRRAGKRVMPKRCQNRKCNRLFSRSAVYAGDKDSGYPREVDR